MMFIPRKFFKEVLNYLTEENIKDLALKVGQSFSNRFKLEITKQFQEIPKIEMIKKLLQHFKRKGFNWVLSIDFFQTKQGVYSLQVVHNFDKKASLFIKEYLTVIMIEIFQFSLNLSTLTEETIDLMFKDSDKN